MPQTNAGTATFGLTLAATGYVNLCVNASHPGRSWFSGVAGAEAYAPAPDYLIPEIAALAGRLLEQRLAPDQTDFHLSLGRQNAWRCKRITASNGDRLFFLRRIGTTVPSFADGMFHFPQWLQSALREVGAQGGLVLFTGPQGAGKTTSAVATYLDLLARRGGVGVAIEDPVEFDLNLTLSSACSVQIDVSGHARGAEHGYALACQSAFRMGAHTGYIGEIRSQPVCAEVIRFSAAAMSLVSTLHATGPLPAIRRAIDLAAAEYGGIASAAAALSASLNAVVTQCLTGNPKAPDFKILFLAPVAGLVSAEESQSIRGMIRAGKTEMLANAIANQEIRLRNRQGPARSLFSAAGGR